MLVSLSASNTNLALKKSPIILDSSVTNRIFLSIKITKINVALNKNRICLFSTCALDKSTRARSERTAIS